MKSAFNLLKETFADWSEDKATRLAAALAYYTIFSIAPLLVIGIGIAGLVLGRQAVQGQLMSQIKGAVGDQAAGLIQTMIQNTSKPSAGIAATVIGIVILLFGASGVFGQLHDALNTVWEVAPKPGRPFLRTLADRIVPFIMVLGIGFLLLVSLVISAVLTIAAQFLGSAVGQTALIGEVVNFVFFFLVSTLLFALIFKILPDAEISWRDVWVGAAFSSLLFGVGRLLLGLYLGWAGVASPYGAAGSLVVLLLWIYYSAQILLLGAEFSQVYAKRYGARRQPSANAIAVTAEMRAQQGLSGGNKAGRGASAQDLAGNNAAARRASVPSASVPGASGRLSTPGAAPADLLSGQSGGAVGKAAGDVVSEEERPARRVGSGSGSLRKTAIALGGLALGILAGAAQWIDNYKHKPSAHEGGRKNH